MLEQSAALLQGEARHQRNRYNLRPMLPLSHCSVDSRLNPLIALQKGERLVKEIHQCSEDDSELDADARLLKECSQCHSAFSVES